MGVLFGGHREKNSFWILSCPKPFEIRGRTKPSKKRKFFKKQKVQNNRKVLLQSEQAEVAFAGPFVEATGTLLRPPIPNRGHRILG